MNLLSNLLRPDWRAAAIGFAMALCFIVGRHYRPERVVTVEKVVTVDRVVTVEKVVQAASVQDKDDTKVKVRYIKVLEKRPDGTVTETTRRDTDTEHTSDDLIAIRLESSKATERIVYKDRESIKVVERDRPNWSVSLMPGYDMSLRKSLLGGSVERRIIGPVHAGAWGNTSGAAGLVVRLEF